MEPVAASEQSVQVDAANEEATEAWSGVLFERFVTYRDLVVAGLGKHGEGAMALYPPPEGSKMLDIGCGFGDTTQRLLELAGPGSEALGVDVSEPFIEAAHEEAAGIENIDFRVVDVQVGDLGEGYDYVFSRMGVMFFANPVAALRNICSSMKPGARFCASVWRQKADNEWMTRAEGVADKYLEHPEETDEPTCGPGPFSMANADTVSEQLQIAGFQEPTLTRLDAPIKIGRDLDHAVEFNLALGPAGELMRVVGPEEAAKVRPKVETELREALNEFESPDGVVAPASTWIIGARAPAA